VSLIDSHCHLDHDYSPKTLEMIIQEAKDSEVETLVTIGTDLNDFQKVQTISENHPQVYHTIGVHPHEAKSLNDSDLSKIESFAKHPKCKAMGEIGLDYHYENSPKETQMLRLEQQLDLALRMKLPVVIHSRDAEEDLLGLLKNYSSKLDGSQVPGVIHCFSGTVTFGQHCLDLGFYISFSGILTFKKADEVRTAAKLFPLDRILVETDSPFLAPIPFRGKKCEPSMVKFTAQKLAEIRNLSFDEIASQTTLNAKKLFRI
jgi:TatD DNase family protein